MLDVTNQNLNVNGTSKIDDNVIMEMSASSDHENIWMTITIKDIPTYLMNQTSIDQDFLDFQTIAINTIKKMVN